MYHPYLYPILFRGFTSEIAASSDAASVGDGERACTVRNLYRDWRRVDIYANTRGENKFFSGIDLLLLLLMCGKDLFFHFSYFGVELSSSDGQADW